MVKELAILPPPAKFLGGPAAMAAERMMEDRKEDNR